MEKAKRKSKRRSGKRKKEKWREGLRRREAVGKYAQTLKYGTHLFIFLSVNLIYYCYLLYIYMRMRCKKLLYVLFCVFFFFLTTRLYVCSRSYVCYSTQVSLFKKSKMLLILNTKYKNVTVNLLEKMMLWHKYKNRSLNRVRVLIIDHINQKGKTKFNSFCNLSIYTIC